MRSVVSLGRLLLRQNGRVTRLSKSYGEVGSWREILCLSGVDGIRSVKGNKDIQSCKDFNPLGTSACNIAAFQRRGFLGCGDGEEGSAVSKTHEESRILGYTPEQLYAVVAAVDMYQDFLPWCQRSDIIRRYPDGSFDAELEIGFKFLVESYVSHVELKKPKFIKSTVSDSNLFDHLTNVWEFYPGPNPGTCKLHFFVDFKFQSPLYRQMASMFFKEVVSRLVSSLHDRCRLVYGPGVPVLESHQRA